MNQSTFQMNTRSLKTRFAASAALVSLMSTAHAEPPMHTDDAGTLAKGGMKVEASLSRDDKERGAEFVYGFAPIDNIEIGLAFTHARDARSSPATQMTGVGLGIKWVPIQNEAGWSMGLLADIGQTRVNDRAASEKFNEREYGLTGLVTYRLENGQVAHLNVGSMRAQAQGQHETLATWGIGYELPIVTDLKLTVETFGADKGRPDKAIGLRYQVIEGLKISGAVGRGNDRTFSQVGISWEF